MRSPKEEFTQAKQAMFVVDAVALRSALEAHVKEYGTQRSAADALGISPCISATSSMGAATSVRSLSAWATGRSLFMSLWMANPCPPIWPPA